MSRIPHTKTATFASCCMLKKWTGNYVARSSIYLSSKPIIPYQRIRASTVPCQRGLSSTTSAVADKSKTVGDHFLDNLGKIFLSGIGLIIGSLVRSSYSTSDKTALRTKTEVISALDPFEIDDLRAANDELTPKVFRLIIERFEQLGYLGHGEHRIQYEEFVSIVMKTMEGIKNDGFTIQLGYLIDRVVVGILKKDGENTDGKLDILLLLTALSLCLHSSVKERVAILFELMLKYDSNKVNTVPEKNNNEDGNYPSVKLERVQKMVGNLQKTCQLVPDAQIVETTTKYPYQTHRIGTPEELVGMGQVMKKEELSDRACSTKKDSYWSCQDFHHLLRSRSVCAWGECYIKTRSLDNSR
jgi:hypothetical protein